MENTHKIAQDSHKDGERPRIAATGLTSKFKPGDKIYLDEPGSRSLSGPYLVASVPSVGKYTLCHENGTKAKDGKVFAEKDLVEG